MFSVDVFLQNSPAPKFHGDFRFTILIYNSDVEPHNTSTRPPLKISRFVENEFLSLLSPELMRLFVG